MCRLRDHPTGTCSFDGFSPDCTPTSGSGRRGRSDVRLSLVEEFRRGFESEDESPYNYPGIASSFLGGCQCNDIGTRCRCPLNRLKQTAVEKTSDEPLSQLNA